MRERADEKGKERALAAPTTRRSIAGFAVADRSDAAARLHMFLSLGFLVLAGGLTLLASLKLSYPAFLDTSGFFSYGRLAPMALTSAVFGWLTFANLAAVYYLLPRLTGARLWNEPAAIVAGALGAIVTLAGVIGIGLGFTDGLPLAEFYWPVDLVLIALYLVPLAIAMMTLRDRTEEGMYISLWYILAGLIWLPGLMIAGNIPGAGAVGGAIQNSFFVSALLGQWAVGLGIGAVYYVIPKATGNPLFSRPLALAGFWSLAFAQLWTGPAQLIFGPASDWIETIAVVFAFGLIVPALAVLANFVGTMSGSWGLLAERADLRFGVAGAVAVAFFALVTGVGGFRSVSAVVGLTPFEAGTRYALVFIAASLLSSSFLYHAFPRVLGRQLFSPGLATAHLRLTLWGGGTTVLLFWLAGIASGYTWLGGAVTGSIPPVGETFVTTLDTVAIFYRLSVLTA
ncbi:MAG: cbb3-type cytochrome c oxidase subunit I, partial [Acidimicrobiia bacterium]|nr:cbb3-type cytochrome c oxidase subunit I [Acidimicrobiia bacterium]